MLILGSKVKRMRRNINPTPLKDNSILSRSSADNSADMITTTILIQSSTPTVPLLSTPSLAPPPSNLLDNITSPIPVQSPTPAMSDEDVNITMHCQSYWFSCRRRCTQKRELGGTEERLQCFCDRNCVFFKDCCADFDQYCSSSGISEVDTNNPDDNGLWECISRHGSFSKAAGIWMISSCPRKWTQVDIKERCGRDLIPSYDNLKDNVPVIDGEGKTFKNRYCAQCHGLNLTDLTFYNFELDCDVPVPKEYERKEILSFVSAFCDRPLWRPPVQATRRYCHRVRPNLNCNDNSLHPNVQQKCLNGSLGLVYQTGGSDKTTFFNPYCAICSRLKTTELRCGPGPSTSAKDGTLAKPFSLVMDLDFSDQDHRWRETSKVRGLKVTCRHRYVYDFHLEVCRPGIAPSDVATVREKTFIVSVWMRSNVEALSPWWPLITKVNFKEAMAKELKMNKSLISNISIGNPSGPVSTVVFNIKINPTKQTNVSTQSLQTAMSSLSIILNYANFTFFKVTVKPFHCAKVQTFTPNEYIKSEGNAVRVWKTGEIFQEADYYTDETEWLNGSLVPIGNLTVCKQPRLNCSGVLVGLNESEYIMLPNGSLYRKDSRETFEPERFLMNNDTIWVCAQFSSSYEVNGSIDHPSKTDGDFALVVITYVGLSLSIVSFVLVLITYSLFKELRTVPGINLMNLSLSHLLVDLVYLATGYVEAKVPCTIIAILLHYFFLVSFVWMSIIALETWKAFSKTRIKHRNSSGGNQRSISSRRIAVGWLPAFVIVVMCIALDQSNAVGFHYGGIKGCWINNSIANLFSFVLPVALSISFNTVFFVLTANAIRKTSKVAQRATHEMVKRKTAVVFLKIFILMGFTWIFGFLKVLVSHYFEYPFIIFTTLQGLYVALAFVFTSRVKQMYRSLLCKAKTNSGTGREDTRL